MFASTLWAFEPDTSDELQLDVARAIIDIKKADPGIEKFFDGAAGYAVIPKVGKGGIGVGGAYGKGLVIVGDKAVGRTYPQPAHHRISAGRPGIFAVHLFQGRSCAARFSAG